MGNHTSSPYVPEESNPKGRPDPPPPPPKAQTLVPVRFMVGQQADNPFNSSGLQASRYGGQSNPHF